MNTTSTSKSTFTTKHLATIFRYAGISFIAGSVSHGAFSEGRSLITVGLGILFFIIGSIIDSYYNSESADQNILKAILIGAILSVGLGFFTGSLQHFPDSPWRSVWLVPTGFLLSMIGLSLLNPDSFRQALKKYIPLSLIAITGLSIGIYLFLAQYPQPSHTHEMSADGSTSHTEQTHTENSITQLNHNEIEHSH